jgi:DNA-binding transcriptional regulator/RsmH inhibitor MraZ
VVEAGGERWQMSLDRHGRLYVPSRLRPMFEEAKTIMVRREDDTLSLEYGSFKTAWRRLKKWQDEGVWDRILRALASIRDCFCR